MFREARSIRKRSEAVLTFDRVCSTIVLVLGQFLETEYTRCGPSTAMSATSIVPHATLKTKIVEAEQRWEARARRKVILGL